MTTLKTTEPKSRVGHCTLSADNRCPTEQPAALNKARDEVEHERTAGQKTEETRLAKIEERRKGIAVENGKRKAEKLTI